MWNLRSGYVSVTERPKAIPPSGSIEYEYNPDPLTPMPPMPPEIFIHYLSHEDGASRIRATNDVRHVNEMKQINATACLDSLLPKSIPT